MSDKFVFELNSEGVKELLNSPEMKDILVEKAKMVQQTAGKDYEVNLFEGKNRPNVSIGAMTKKAKKDNLKHNTLLKALGSVRGKQS